MWEEAPAACLTPDLREALCASAVQLAKSVSYRGAGTLEYLYDEAAREFFFIEMNTRIQVEHPITEMITGVDLVQAMIRIAGGEPLPFSQSDIVIRGHAIEVRINAEDPARNFMPGPGRVAKFAAPEGSGVRFDTMLYEGYVIPPFYDSLLGKLIAGGETRPAALAQLRSRAGRPDNRGRSDDSGPASCFAERRERAERGRAYALARRLARRGRIDQRQGRLRARREASR